MRIAMRLCACVGLAFVATGAHAETVLAVPVVDPADATMSVMIGSESFGSIPLNWVPSVDPTTNKTVFNLSLLGGPIVLTAADGSTFSIGGAAFDPDPLLLFSANATNNGTNPLTFSFAFNAPMSPSLLGTVSSHAELGVTLTDGLNDGAAVQPLVGAGTMLKSFDLYGNGGSVSKNVDIGTLFAIASGTSTTSYSADNALVCSPACVTMSTVLTFTLTGRDSVGFSGKVVQSQVPLPAPAVLLGSALAGLLGFRRRRAVTIAAS